jgi:hypothetical protein
LFITYFFHDAPQKRSWICMLQTFEAITDQHGHVRLLESATLPASRHVLVTLLPEPAPAGDVDPQHGTISSAMECREDCGVDVVEFFQRSPLYGVALDLTRDADTGREVAV